MDNEFLSSAEFEAETISRAMSGDVEAGITALRICDSGLCGNALSEPMRFYLAQCLRAVVEGVSADRALNVEIQRGPGAPKKSEVEARDTLLAVWVKLAIDRGMRSAEAKAEAGDFWNVLNVDRALRGVKVTAQDDGTGFWDEVFAAKGKPLPLRQ